MGTKLQPSQLNSPGKDIESYLSSVHSIPILTKEEEQELALKLYEEDDLDAARQLVIHHLRFVVHIARSYQGYGLPLGDIIQEGNVGLNESS
jgi:RNA polymerase sigma-32 factor